MKYRKKPVVIEAVQWNYDNINELIAFAGDAITPNLDSGSGIHQPTIKTLEGTMRISGGDYVIKGVAGEFYPCKEEIFNATYEHVAE